MSLKCLATTAAIGLPLAIAQADSTIDAERKFAYSANAGWVNFDPADPVRSQGVVFGEYVCSGFAYAANFGWVNFGDEHPADGIRYRNDSASDYGVNHDGQGNLSGFAYAANVGWINFGWTESTSDPNRPRVDLLSGEFAGFAYGANIGWLNLGTGLLAAAAMDCRDSDGDGIGDAWERVWFDGLSTATADSDADGDGRSDRAEYLARTDPTDPTDRLVILKQDVSADAAQVALEFTSSPTRNYRIEKSGDLRAPWADAGFGEFVPDAGARTSKTVMLPEGTLQQFLRVRPIKPLQP